MKILIDKENFLSFSSPLFEEIIPSIFELQKRVNKKIYLSGGFLRNILLKRESNDIDLVVIGASGIEMAKELSKMLGLPMFILDKETDTARIVHKAKNSTIDLSGPRGKDIFQDLNKRDFTINAMAVEIMPGSVIFQLIDPLGGIRDLCEGIIRMVKPSAFDNDALRILRAYRFVATLGFKIEQETHKYLISKAALLKEISAERIRDEIFRILKHNSSQVIENMLEDSVLQKALKMDHIPSNIVQNLSVLEGFIEYLEKTNRQILLPDLKSQFIGERTYLDFLKFLLLFTTKDSKPEFTIFEHLALSRKERKFYKTYLENIDVINQIYERKLTCGITLDQFLASYREKGILMLLLRLCLEGEIVVEEIANYLTSLYRRLNGFVLRKLDEAKKISGRMLMEKLSLPQGPEVGMILKELEKAFLEERIGDEKEAVELAVRIYKNQKNA